MRDREFTALTSKEERFRGILLHLLLSALTLVGALLVLYKVPYYPPSVALILAVALAAVGFRSPALALSAIFFFSIPAYTYQLALPLPIAAGMAAVLLLVALLCLDSLPTALGAALGMVAAMLMLTPYYFLAIPVIIGIALFRARDIKAGSLAGLLVFLALYLPLLASSLPAGGTTQIVPLFDRVSLAAPLEPLSIVDTKQMALQLVDRVAQGRDQILDSLSAYLVWGRLLGLVLALLLGAGIGAAVAGLSLFKWLEQQEIGGRKLLWVGPILSMLFASGLVLVPLYMLSGPFLYSIDLPSYAFVGLMAGAALIGGMGSLADGWARRRTATLELRARLNAVVPRVAKAVEDLHARLDATRAVSPKIDLFEEETASAKGEQELSFIAAALDSMDYYSLSDKLTVCHQMEKLALSAFEAVEAKLYRCYDERRQEHNDHVHRAKEFGLPLGEPIPGPPFAQLSSLGYKQVLDEQAKLNDRFRELAEGLVAAASDIAQAMREEVDPQFSPMGLAIARSYLEQGEYQEAAETVLNELLTMDHVVRTDAAAISRQIVSVIAGFGRALEDGLIPAMEFIGDNEAMDRFARLSQELAGWKSRETDSRDLSHLITTMKQSRQLPEAAALAMSELLTKIKELEARIEAKAPPGYNWGRNAGVAEVEGVIQPLKDRTASLANRLAAVQDALSAMETEAAVIRQYATTNEFFINYANIEYIVSQKLQEQGTVTSAELPVKPVYAREYLKVFSHRHYDLVGFDPRTDALSNRRQEEA